MEDRVKERLQSIPAKPGVYLFRDARGDVLYVGKAKSLRPRVRNYFQKGGDGRAQIAQLPGRVADIEVIVTGSEVEALHLEQNLVKRHRPPFNVRLRDDKSFPYIAVTVEDEYPRVMFTRERHRAGVWYFGPYANAKKVRETLDVLNRVFPYRPCEGPKPGRHSGIPCLDYHIDRCLAPCVGYVSKDDYRGIIDQVIEFLSGETDPIQRELERKMREAAAGERFEEAARYRNRLRSVQHLAERQAAARRSVGTIDVVGLAAEGDRAVVQVFPLRDGRLIDRYSFHLENVGGQDLTTVLESFCLEYYGSAPSVPPQIVVPRDAGDTSALSEFLSERRGARVDVRAAERGEKRRLQELASENARHALASESHQSELKRLRRVEALEELREVLNLEALPIRIECFDISTAMGQDNVGSTVVFQDGVAKKAHYRKFGIKGQDGMDDFAAMAEGGARRLRRDGGGGVAALGAALGRDGGGLRRVVRRAAEPRRHRRRQGPVVRGARGDAQVRPAARGGRRPGEARRRGLRARAPGPDPPGSTLTGAATAAARPRRGAPVRRRLPPSAPRLALVRVDLRRARRRRPGPPARPLAALRLRRAVPRGVTGRARGRSGRSGEDGARDLCAIAQSRTRVDHSIGSLAPAIAKRRRRPIPDMPQWKAAPLPSHRSSACPRVSGRACASYAWPRA